MWWLTMWWNAHPWVSWISGLSASFLSISLLPLFAPWLRPLETGIVAGHRFHQIKILRLIKFTRTTASKNADPARKHDDGAWYFLVGGRNLFSPSVACSNPLQVLETYWLCRINHCTFTHQVFVVTHTVKRGSMICWEAYLDQESRMGS